MVKEVMRRPPKLTAVAPVKLVPVIVIVVPGVAVAGVNDVIVGGGIKVKPGREAIPIGVVTATFPLDPCPSTATTDVGEETMNDAAGVPPKLTALTVVRFVPVIVILAPAPPDVPLKDVIVGARRLQLPAGNAVIGGKHEPLTVAVLLVI